MNNYNPSRTYENENANEIEFNGDAHTSSSAFIHSYISPKKIFGLAFMNDCNSITSSRLRCAISSMDFTLNNYIQLIEYDNDNKSLTDIAQVHMKYPCTKLSWANEKYTLNLLATASDSLRLYTYNEQQSLLIETKCLTTPSTKEGPLTALEWNCINYQIIGISSIDTTVSIWDIAKEERINHLIANDKECYDLSFGNQEYCFITCGGDGTIRQFDLRSKDNCWLVYKGSNGIIKSKWNSLNDNFIAFTALDDKEVHVIDRRNSNSIYSSLKHHSDNVNNCLWSPKSNCILMSVADDSKAVLWDIQNSKGTEAIMEYKAEGAIENCDWCEGNEANWVSIAYDNTCQMLLLNK